MIDKIKWYLINVGLNKYLPMAGMAAITALGTFMAAHAGVLEQYGVTFGNWPLVWPIGQEPSGHVILIELDTLSTASATAAIALVTMLWSAAQHHITPVPPKPEDAQSH